MDLNAIQQAPLPVTPINNSANITNVRRGPITDEEKQRKRNLNLCLHIGSILLFYFGLRVQYAILILLQAALCCSTFHTGTVCHSNFIIGSILLFYFVLKVQYVILI